MTSLPFGIRENLTQFTHQLIQVLLVGFAIGMMRTVIPALAETEFGVARGSFMLLTAFVENGGGKLGHGSGGIVPLRAEQNPSTLPFLYLEGGLGDPYRGTLPEGPSGVCQRDERAPGGASLQHIARECAQDPVVFGAARLPAAEAGAAAQAG